MGSAVFNLLKRFWVVVLVVVALIVAAAVVGRLRTFFDTDQPLAADAGNPDLIVAFNTKQVTYEILGPNTAVGGSATSTTTARPMKQVSPPCRGR